MTATFYVGDAVTVMNTLPEKSIDLILTSPPFLALRSYLPQDHPDKALEGGSQATPGAYIDWLLDVVEACARVLAPHGSLCFELGDTYSGSGGAGGDYLEDGLRDGQPKFAGSNVRKAWIVDHDSGRRNPGRGWPLAKSLSLIPETFRFAMVYGHNPHTGRTTQPWRLRNVIRWVRPNPPVGALGDKFRPATSELMVFCKAKDRFFDLDAVREPHKRDYELEAEATAKRRDAYNIVRSEVGLSSLSPSDGQSNAVGAPPLDWWNIPLLEGEEETLYGPRSKEPRDLSKGIPNKALAHSPTKGGSWGDEETKIMFENPAGAPPMDWWEITAGGFSGAHYAVWPPELLVKPIKAMCPSLVCVKCGPVYDVRTVPQSGSAEERPLLLQEVRVGLGSETTGTEQGLHDPSGLHHGEWNAGPSDGDSGGLHIPASSSHGEVLGPDALAERGRSSQERNQERQSGRELGSDGPGRPHNSGTDGTRTPNNAMSPLRGSSEFIRDCPTCGGNLRAGTVLDPFAGSGTTLSVATGHGRDAIGVDLDERNYELALDRVGPLILERGTEPARRINS